MSHWHYQLMRHLTPDGYFSHYAVHEYYELDDGPTWTEDPVIVDGESIDEVRRVLIYILKDLETHGVKDYE